MGPSWWVMTQRITIGQDVLEPKGTDGRSRDLVLMRRASDGVFDWSTVAGGAEDDRPAGLVLDGTANPLVGIHMVASGTYSGHELTHAGNGDLGFWSYGVDLDEDGVTDGADLCPRTPNPDQANHDGDSLGDVCDDDDDGDGVIDAADACPLGLRNWISSGLSDHDRDGCRDLDEDHDDDEDGIADENDVDSAPWVGSRRPRMTSNPTDAQMSIQMVMASSTKRMSVQGWRMSTKRIWMGMASAMPAIPMRMATGSKLHWTCVPETSLGPRTHRMIMMGMDAWMRTWIRTMMGMESRTFRMHAHVAS